MDWLHFGWFLLVSNVVTLCKSPSSCYGVVAFPSTFFYDKLSMWHWCFFSYWWHGLWLKCIIYNRICLFFLFLRSLNSTWPMLCNQFNFIHVVASWFQYLNCIMQISFQHHCYFLRGVFPWCLKNFFSNQENLLPSNQNDLLVNMHQMFYNFCFIYLKSPNVDTMN